MSPIISTEHSDLRKKQLSTSDKQNQIKKSQLQTGIRTELWHASLFGLFLLVLAEGIVLFQRKKTTPS